MRLNRLILTTDFSPCARGAYAAAADLARRQQARLDLVHGIEVPSSYPVFDYTGSSIALRGYRKELGEELQEEASDSRFHGLEVEQHLLEGYGPEAVSRHAEKSGADLIVQSSHGHRGFKRLLLGSFAERVVRLAPVPVLTFKNRVGKDGEDVPVEVFRPKRILFPYDLSPTSLQALDAVRFLALAYDARVTVLYAWEDLREFPPIHGLGNEAVSEEIICVGEELPRRLLQDLGQFARRSLGDVKHECQVLKGEPASRIIEQTETGDVSLVCMATHGRTGLRAMLLGSVAEKVLRRVNCPVFTVRPPREALREQPPVPVETAAD